MLAIICVAMILPLLQIVNNAEGDTQPEAPKWFVIQGLVENPLNLTYAELRDFPLLSEVTTLQCVETVIPGVTYNWTGVPLFCLLSMARVKPGGYREVIFNATDGYANSVPLETAMDPTSILALEANGTDLEQINDLASGHRVVFPCRWGYKWVRWVQQITVVDYVYKSYDEAIRPNCTMPSTEPPYKNFTATKWGQGYTYTVQALSNSPIESFGFANTQMVFNLPEPEESSGYFYVTFPKELMATPYQVTVGGNPVYYSQIEADSKVYIYFSYAHTAQTITIAQAQEISGQGGCPSKPLTVD